MRRGQRADLRAQLKKGEVTLEEVLNRDDPVVARIRRFRIYYSQCRVVGKSQSQKNHMKGR